jgi:hypothetical protein
MLKARGDSEDNPIAKPGVLDSVNDSLRFMVSYFQHTTLLHLCAQVLAQRNHPPHSYVRMPLIVVIRTR